jgi:hypothetical protein
MVQTLSMRTKLLMVAVLSLTVSVALMAVTADTANAQVTEIRKVINQTDEFVYIWNRESGARTLIFPRSYAPNNQVQYNQWVPWATNATEFNRGKYIEFGYRESGLVQCGGVQYCVRFAIWQEANNTQPFPGNYIRFTVPTFGYGLRYIPSAPPMPGESTAGGRRNLYIRPVPGYPSAMTAMLATTRE